MSAGHTRLEDTRLSFLDSGGIEAIEAAMKAGTCRFIGFTGHHDPEVHAALLRAYDG